MNENELSNSIIGFCIKIHQRFGPGLFESVYEEALCNFLTKENIFYSRQQAIAFTDENFKMQLCFRADIIVFNKVLIEIKSVESLAPVHKKQILTYLRLADLKLGLLINFNVDLLKEGIFRVVNKL